MWPKGPALLGCVCTPMFVAPEGPEEDAHSLELRELSGVSAGKQTGPPEEQQAL